MKYNGMKLVDISGTPQIIDPPRDMLVWDDALKDTRYNSVSEPIIAKVLAIVNSDKLNGNVIAETPSSFVRYEHCAEIPKARRATWQELAYWLIDGKGLVVDESRSRVDTGVYFNRVDLDAEVSDDLKVMRRGDTEWHEPTVDYMGI